MSKKSQPSKIVVRCGTVEVGDIFYSSWGYEQTNIDFYQVVSLHGTKTVTIRAICSETVEYNQSTMTGSKKPIPNSFKEDEEPLKRRVLDYCSEPHIRIADYENAWKADKDIVKEFSTYA